jgi:cyclic beta-1,2-glucan synthetase
MYRIGIEHILGIKKRGESILLDPCIPTNWSEYTVKYKYGKSQYEIYIRNPQGLNKGVKKVTLDGNEIIGNILKLTNDGKVHAVKVIMG